MAVSEVTYEVNVDLSGLYGAAAGRPSASPPPPSGGGPFPSPAPLVPQTASAVAAIRVRDLSARRSTQEIATFQAYQQARAAEKLARMQSRPYRPWESDGDAPITQATKAGIARTAGFKANAGKASGIDRPSRILRSVRAIGRLADAGSPVGLLSAVGNSTAARIAGRALLGVAAVGGITKLIGDVRESGVTGAARGAVGGVGEFLGGVTTSLGEQFARALGRKTLDPDTLEYRDAVRKQQWLWGDVASLGLGFTGVFDNYREAQRSDEENAINKGKAEARVVEIMGNKQATLLSIASRNFDEAFGIPIRLQQAGLLSRSDAGNLSWTLATAVGYNAPTAHGVLLERARAQAQKEFPHR